MEDLVRAAEAFVRSEMGADVTGHDWWHVDRVRKSALSIARAEGADLFIVELAALMHDIKDEKFSGSAEAGPAAVRGWLETAGVDQVTTGKVIDVVRAVSFKGAGVPDVEVSLEGACVRDADRLDALGAIGIARTFAFGGAFGRPIYDPEVEPVFHASAQEYRSGASPTINHFYEKLLLLSDRMVTPTGRLLARERHEFMLEFLARFDAETK